MEIAVVDLNAPAVGAARRVAPRAAEVAASSATQRSVGDQLGRRSCAMSMQSRLRRPRPVVERYPSRLRDVCR